MNEVAGITGDHRFRLELIDLTRRIAPEKLAAVLESLSPVGLADLMKSTSALPTQSEPPRSKGKELLEQALSILK